MRSRAIRRPLIACAAAGAVLSFTACGNATETGIEKLIESQGGGDVDLDLNGDGGLSVQTEEGGMSIDEDGNFVITDANGSVVTGNADSESGEFNMESEDGSFRVDSSGEIPEEWPSDVPLPEGIENVVGHGHPVCDRTRDHDHGSGGIVLRRPVQLGTRGRRLRADLELRIGREHHPCLREPVVDRVGQQLPRRRQQPDRGERVPDVAMTSTVTR